jgi:predicted O-linked N-acetylglucosamine transferase (SPINDLY family)
MRTLREAMAAHQSGRFFEAEDLYRRVLEVDDRQFPVLAMLGILNAQLGKFQDAERLLRDALSINPADAGVQFNYANVLLQLRRFDEAFTTFGEALALNPNLAEAHLNRGGILMSQKRFEEAITCFDAAVRANQNYGEAHCNRGNALQELRRFDDALASYGAAIAINPQNAEFHASCANALHRLHRHEEALGSLSLALALQPGKADFHYNRGNLLFETKHFAEASIAYDDAFRLDPQADYVEGDRFFAKMVTCNWANVAAENTHLVAGVADGRLVSRPFAFLTAESSQALQTRCSNLFADREFPALPPLWTGERYSHDRIRVAYLSADFRNHPVSHMLVGMFEYHNRARFETIGVSFGADDESPIRRRVKSAFDRFYDVRQNSDAEIARLLREEEVDIAVDLMGPTQSARPGILSYRPAPIQVTYLGYAGSSGAPYIDYILADRIVIPEIEQQLFREKVIYLPETFMASDSRRAISTATPSRADEGLPDTGFVFCAFANSYKTSLCIFDVWMQLLAETDGSVLWLSSNHEAAEDNLRREAVSRRIAPERLVFAHRVVLNEEHLARHRLADLFLDTLPLGAHSTASDALWAGTPVITCVGNTFGGRVAASLLSALGLEELITNNLSDYRDLALRIAHYPQMLDRIKTKLDFHRGTFPLFNTQRFTSHVEAGYIAAWELYQRDEQPMHLSVSSLSSA